MILSDKEAAKLRKLLKEMELGLGKRAYRSYVGNRIRNIRLMLNRADRRDKNTLL